MNILMAQNDEEGNLDLPETDEFGLELETDLEKDFAKAALRVRNLATQLDAEALLYLYARYKLATEGACNVPRPGFFDFKGKQKWDAWKALDRLGREEAMKEYVAKVEQVSSDGGLAGGSASSSMANANRDGFGIGISTLASSQQCREDEKDDSDSLVLSAVKSGDLAALSKLAQEDILAEKDAEGLTALHWACDRGFEPIVRHLLKLGAKADSLDQNGQSPLHYAASCDHEVIVRILLEFHANPAIKDADGLMPADLAELDSVRKLLNNDSV